MIGFAQLKLIAAKRPVQLSPVVQRRNKVAKRIAEQIALATAKQDGKSYAPTKQRKVTDAVTGDSQIIQVPKRIKEWWFVTDTGKLCVQFAAFHSSLQRLKRWDEISWLCQFHS